MPCMVVSDLGDIETRVDLDLVTEAILKLRFGGGMPSSMVMERIADDWATLETGDRVWVDGHYYELHY